MDSEKVLVELYAYRRKLHIRMKDVRDMEKREFYEGLDRGITYAIDLLEEGNDRIW